MNASQAGETNPEELDSSDDDYDERVLQARAMGHNRTGTENMRQAGGGDSDSSGGDDDNNNNTNEGEGEPPQPMEGQQRGGAGVPRTPLHISEDPSSDGLFSPAVKALVQQSPAAAAAASAAASAAGGNGAASAGGGTEGDTNNEGTSEAADEATATGAGAEGPSGGQRKWVCDACKVATFASYEEACRHEETCTGIFPADHPPPPPPPPAAAAADAAANLPAVGAAATAATTNFAATAVSAPVPGASVGMVGKHASRSTHGATAPGLAPGLRAATGMGVAAGAPPPPPPPPPPPGMAVYAPRGYPPATRTIPASMNVPPFPPPPHAVLGSAPLPEQGADHPDPNAMAAYLRHQQAILRAQETRALVGHHAHAPPPFLGHPPAGPNGGLGVAPSSLYPAAALPPPPVPPPAVLAAAVAAAAKTGGNNHVTVRKTTPPPLQRPLGTAAAVAAAAGSATTVPETVPMAGPTLVEVYVCDVCRMAQFDSYEEAVRHEEECDGGAPGAGAGSNVADINNSFAGADADISAAAGVAATQSSGPGTGSAKANGTSGGVGTDINVSEPIAEIKDDDDDGTAAFLESRSSIKLASPAIPDVGLESSDEKDLPKPKEVVGAPPARPDHGTNGTKRKLDEADVTDAETQAAPAAKNVLASDKNTPLQLDRPLSELPRRKKPRPPTKYQCGSCDFCMVDSCGTCKACLDMPRFGGPGTYRRACQFRPSCPNRPAPQSIPTKREPALVSKEMTTGASNNNAAPISDGGSGGTSNDSDQLWTFVAIDGHRYERMRGHKKRIPQVLVVWQGGERTWEPAQNVKEDDPVTFFRYVDRVGLEEQSEKDSKSKLAGKEAWKNVVKDGRPPLVG